MALSSQYRVPFDGRFLRWSLWRKILWFLEDRVAGAHSGSLQHAIDVMLPIGTPVLAAAAGTIVWIKIDAVGGGISKRYWEGGNRIVIRHENDEFTAYEHLKNGGVLVRVGDHVQQGQQIGWSGRTGYGFLPHLHFEVFTHPIADLSEGETIPIVFDHIGRVQDGAIC